jgi:cell division protein FtsZ
MTTPSKPEIHEMRPNLTVIGIGGGGGNAVNNMMAEGLEGAEFIVTNTDAQALKMSKAPTLIQLGALVTEGLGAGSLPDIGQAAAEESIDEIMDHLAGTHMCFITAGMGGGTGTGAAPVIAKAARAAGILTVAVVTKPFTFEGKRRLQTAVRGIELLREAADTVIVIPNQNLFRMANANTTIEAAFGIVDRVLYSGVSCITNLIVKGGLINLDFADVKTVMQGMGRATMGTGVGTGEGRAMRAAEASIANPLLDENSIKTAKGVLVSISGDFDMTLFEVDEAAMRIREEVGEDTDIVVGAVFDEALQGQFKVSVVAAGLEATTTEVDPIVITAGRSTYGLMEAAR